MDDKGNVLADYVAKRITLTGYFDKFSLYVGSVRQWRTALLQDVFAEVEGKQIDLGHVWVQKAEAMRNLGLVCGDRLRCNCRVGVYRKRLTTPNKDGLMVVERCSLSWPTGIEVISRATKAEFPATFDDHAVADRLVPRGEEGPGNPVSLIVEMKALAERAGGWEGLQQLIDVLRTKT